MHLHQWRSAPASHLSESPALYIYSRPYVIANTYTPLYIHIHYTSMMLSLSSCGMSPCIADTVKLASRILPANHPTYSTAHVVSIVLRY